MKTNDCYYLGYIAKTIGVEGLLLAILEVDDPLEYRNMESVFVQIEGKLVPFFIEEIGFRAKKGETVIRFEDINSIDEARHLCKKELFLPAETGADPDGAVHLHRKLKGYKAFDSNNNLIGTIIEVYDFPGNPVMSITRDNKEVMVPLAEDLVDKIDHEKGIVFLVPPDGLLDMY